MPPMNPPTEPKSEPCPTCGGPAVVFSDDDGTSHYVPANYVEAWQHPEMQEWAKHFNEDVLPMIEGSVLSASLVPEKGGGDVKFWVELGASIMMDKPIVAIACSEDDVPAKLRELADKVIIVADLDSQENIDMIAREMVDIVKGLTR